MNSKSTQAPTGWPAAVIPLHYHYHMLNDQARMTSFKSAIEFIVKPGSKVVELGGGSAVMSFLAAQRAAKVYCVEIDPSTAEAARQILQLNGMGDKVEVIQASALEYLPPEPVDVVICEMVHVAMLREHQLEVVDSFRSRYLEKFGCTAPIFIPCAAILAVQPVHQDFNFHGYRAPMPIFQQADAIQPRTQELGDTVVTHILDYKDKLTTRLVWDGQVTIATAGEFNAVRFITKNILAIDQTVTPPSFIHWFSQYLVLPLPKPVKVETGQKLRLHFDYAPGSDIPVLQKSLQLVEAS